MEWRLFERVSSRRRRSARIVGRSPNAVHSVLYRVRVFVNGSRRRFLLQVEFLARILRVVYVGAIAVLFRFVVMMLNLSETVTRIDPSETWNRKRYRGARRVVGRGLRGYRGYQRSEGARRRDPRRVQVGALGSQEARSGKYVEWVKRRDGMWGMSTFGQMFYTDGRVYVVASGMVLLVSMIGSIVLTLKVRTFARAKRQQVDQQRSRDADRATMLVRSSRESEQK